MTETVAPPAGSAQPAIVRFGLPQRIEHAVFLVAFTILAVTGLAQKYSASGIGELVLRLLGGIETARLIHRVAAVVLLVVAIYHILAVLHRLVVRRVRLTMLPVPEDFRHLYQDVLFYLGRGKRKGYYGRYSYAEKVEYLAVVWGTVIMAVTGFMMWNPIATARALPGEVIPAAKSAHGWEALLAVLAIVIWHFYHVHVRHFNRSMFTGQLTRDEMHHEHPAELAELDGGLIPPPPPPADVRRRMRMFLPAAVVLTIALGYGLIRFVTLEETAILTVPPGETGPVFVPQTPTPAPTPSAAPTLPPPQSLTWNGGVGAYFASRCLACHGASGLGQLDLRTYAAALQGGQSGVVVLPGEPETSLLILRQVAGNHPGQLTADELTQVRLWIDAGAPEK